MFQDIDASEVAPYLRSLFYIARLEDKLVLDNVAAKIAALERRTDYTTHRSRSGSSSMWVTIEAREAGWYNGLNDGNLKVIENLLRQLQFQQQQTHLREQQHERLASEVWTHEHNMTDGMAQFWSTVTGGPVSMLVTSADTGATHSVVLGPGEEHVQHFKAKLAALARVAPEDQILLCGPRYKRLDATFARAPLAPGSRIFLYDRRLLMSSESTPAAAAAGAAAQHAGTAAVVLPTEPGEMPPELATAAANLAQSKASPLLSTLAGYERWFMTALNQGQVLAAAAQQRRAECESCWAEARAQRDALAAAVSNLSDHATSLGSSFEEVTSALSEQEGRHQALIDSFETDLAALGGVPLHPSLAPRLAPSPSAAPPATLLDCVPVERERTLVAACRESHRSFQAHLAQARTAWGEVSAGVQQLVAEYCSDAHAGGGSGGDGGDQAETVTAEAATAATAAAAALVSSQLQRLNKLERNYEEVVRVATEQLQLAAAGGEAQQGGATIIALVQELDTRYNAQTDMVPAMQQADAELCELLHGAARAKAAQDMAVRARLHEVSTLQSRIQEILNWARLMGRARAEKEEQFSHLEKKEEQFSHLEKVQRMPAAHAALLSEVVRRRAYGALVAARAAAAAEDAASLRSAEIVARDAFLRRHMVNLPVAFLEAAPALSRMPPRFIPTIDDQEDQALPDIRAEDIGLTDDAVAAAVMNARAEGDGEASPPHAPAVGSGGGGVSGGSGGGSGGHASERPPPALVKGSLILPAEEAESGSAHDDRSSGVQLAARAAELKYQNAMLRAEVLRLQQQQRSGDAEVLRLQDAVRRLQQQQQPAPQPRAEAAAAAAAAAAVEPPPPATLDHAQQASPAVEPVGTQTDTPAAATVATADASHGTADQAPQLAEPAAGAAAVASSEVPAETVEAAAAASAAQERGLEDVEALLHGVAKIERLVRSWQDEDAAAAEAGAAVSTALAAAAGSGSSSAAAPAGVSVDQVAALVESALRAAARRARAAAAADTEARVAEAARAAAARRIAFRDFAVGDLALFLPTSHSGSSRVYLAFHMNYPHPYLARESVDEICKRAGRFPDFILGRVIMVDRQRAPPPAEEGKGEGKGEGDAEGEGDDDANPYNTTAGQEYYVLTATSY
ncbi:hypothetical protein JKP88DRAFT_352875 [Tribonema minus]|uniref:Autophagy-related protein 11 C-terminal domain-containing protein n=1 Tax=Tribonema minus TaxID=303371 RepID=A0A835ZAC9_9STRA|nr:hypothetical protein JKP88DRAFT_352875 [Tribonema minus]